MTRVKTGATKHRKHKKVLAQTKGHQGVRHTLFRRANESLLHALRYSYLHRKRKKNDMRKLWQIRINAASRQNGLSYSKLIHGMKKLNININRKLLADLATNEPTIFNSIVELVKEKSAA